MENELHKTIGQIIGLAPLIEETATSPLHFDRDKAIQYLDEMRTLCNVALSQIVNPDRR